MSDLHNQFAQYLSKENLRYSSQKKEIVSAIIEKQDHFEIDSFISDVHLKGKRMARATVYRTIKQLLNAKLIQKITADNGRVYYEYNDQLDYHDHMICSYCGQILEIKNTAIDALLKKECDALGFEQEYRSLHLYGKCVTCAKSRDEGRPS